MVFHTFVLHVWVGTVLAISNVIRVAPIHGIASVLEPTQVGELLLVENNESEQNEQTSWDSDRPRKEKKAWK